MLQRVASALFAAAFSLGLSGSLARGEVRLPAIFSTHMVLQRDQPIPVWGWAAPGEKVQIALGSATAAADADAEGRWSVKLPACAAGGPHELVVSGSNRLTVGDVWIGEVWLCSGQSNMAMTVNRARDFESEQAAAQHPRIRQFKVASNYASEPQTDCRGEWTVCGPDSVGGFSATAYFFAREIERTLDVPVGIINSSVGGTPIESWISESAQRGCAELKELFIRIDAERKAFDPVAAKARYEEQMARYREAARAARAAGKTPGRPPQDPVAQFEKKANGGGLFNGMIAPIVGYGFRGALWYQGEANTTSDKAKYYRHQLPLLVTDWRSRHNAGDFPFAWVQLPNFKGSGRNWPLVREAMLSAANLPHTGVAVTIDVGETNDIHPKNKQEVGRRLALWALGDVYGQDAPRVPRVIAQRALAGGKYEVEFGPGTTSLQQDAADVALAVAAVADASRRWHPAKIEIVEGRRVQFAASGVSDPVAVRYAWSNDPPAGLLRTAEGLPVSPFRTDDWEDAAPFDAAQ